MRFLWVGQIESFTDSNKFWNEINFPYQEGHFSKIDPSVGMALANAITLSFYCHVLANMYISH